MLLKEPADPPHDRLHKVHTHFLLFLDACLHKCERKVRGKVCVPCVYICIQYVPACVYIYTQAVPACVYIYTQYVPACVYIYTQAVPACVYIYTQAVPACVYIYTQAVPACVYICTQYVPACVHALSTCAHNAADNRVCLRTTSMSISFLRSGSGKACDKSSLNFSSCWRVTRSGRREMSWVTPPKLLPLLGDCRILSC